MLKNLALTRPLAVIDLETTGVNPQTDRIVEACVLKLLPAGGKKQITRRLNPGIPIPAEASAVHGIFDADVAGEPAFAAVAGSLMDLLDGCDLCGFNIRRFDLRVLHAEFQRAGRSSTRSRSSTPGSAGTWPPRCSFTSPGNTPRPTPRPRT